MNIFVAGTDTGLGKTMVSTLLCLKLRQYCYWKPIQSGTDLGTDTDWVSTQIGSHRVIAEAYRLPMPLSPHASAENAGVTIHFKKIERAYVNLTNVIVEGVGGLLVPLNKKSLLIDLIVRLQTACGPSGLPIPQHVVLVTRSSLGTINHTLLSLEALRQRGIQPLGVVMVGDINNGNKRAIERYGKTNVIGEIPWLTSFNKTDLMKATTRMNIERLHQT